MIKSEKQKEKRVDKSEQNLSNPRDTIKQTNTNWDSQKEKRERQGQREYLMK